MTFTHPQTVSISGFSLPSNDHRSRKLEDVLVGDRAGNLTHSLLCQPHSHVAEMHHVVRVELAVCVIHKPPIIVL